MSLQFGVNIPVQRRARPCHCLCLLSIKQTVRYLYLVSASKQQARLAKQLGYWTRLSTPSVLWCCWLGLLICKTHYRVGEPIAAWQFVDIRPHQSFDNGWQYVSCGQRQPPLSGAPVNKMAVNYHEGETDTSGFRVWWNSLSLRDIFVPPYRQCLTGSSWQQQQQQRLRCESEAFTPYLQTLAILDKSKETRYLQIIVLSIRCMH